MHGCLARRAESRFALCCLLVLALVAVPGLASVPPTADAAASKKTCRKGKRVVACPKAPRAAKRPRRSVNEQGPRSLTPEDVENGGGIGGGPDANPVAAMLWAKSQLSLGKWAWRCERFVEEAYGTRYQFPTAAAAAKALDLHKGNAPVGALVYFGPDKANHGWDTSGCRSAAAR